MSIETTNPNHPDYLWVVEDRIRFLGNVPGSRLDMLEIDVMPGSGTPPHTHESPEMFYILEGELTLREFGAGMPPKTIRAQAGMSVRIPSRVPHNYVNESGKAVRMLVLLEPSMTAFFREIGSLDRPMGAPDFARIGAAMEKHGIEALAMAA